MKIKWKKGAPGNSGYYLAWAPHEDDYPTVLRCDIRDSGVEWWTYPMHKVVVSESVNAFILPAIEEIISKFAYGTKAEMAVVKRISEALEDHFEGMDGGLIGEAIENIANDGSTCVYDVGRPDYWAELPNLYSIDSPEADAARTEGDPNLMDVEVEDIKASAISQVANQLESILNRELSNLSSPWSQPTAPWAKNGEDEK